MNELTDIQREREIHRKMMLAEMEETLKLLREYMETHRGDGVTAADILRLTAITQIAIQLRSIDSTLEAMLGKNVD